MSNSTRIEVDAVEAMRMLDLSEEILGKIAEQEKLKTRHADGTVYFLRQQILDLLARQLDEARPAEFPGDDPGENDAVQG